MECVCARPLFPVHRIKYGWRSLCNASCMMIMVFFSASSSLSSTCPLRTSTNMYGNEPKAPVSEESYITSALGKEKRSERDAQKGFAGSPHILRNYVVSLSSCPLLMAIVAPDGRRSAPELYKCLTVAFVSVSRKKCAARLFLRGSTLYVPCPSSQLVREMIFKLWKGEE